MVKRGGSCRTHALPMLTDESLEPAMKTLNFAFVKSTFIDSVLLVRMLFVLAIGGL